MANKKFNMIFLGRRIGFTLTEILIVVIIIAILATLALPMLVKTIEKAKVGEAISNLNLIRTGEKVYYLENMYYLHEGNAVSGVFDTNKGLPIEDPNASTSRYFDYTVINKDGGADFEAKAVRNAGPRKDDTYTIHVDGKIEGPLL